MGASGWRGLERRERGGAVRAHRDFQPARVADEDAGAKVQRGGEQPFGNLHQAVQDRSGDGMAAAGRVVDRELQVVRPGGRTRVIREPTLVREGSALGVEAGDQCGGEEQAAERPQQSGFHDVYWI